MKFTVTNVEKDSRTPKILVLISEWKNIICENSLPF
jgi:hypothetical protein